MNKNKKISEYDIPMLKIFGFGIAFNPRDEKIKKAADAVIEDDNLEEVLAYFSLKKFMLATARISFIRV